MTVLRKRMIEDLRIRNYSERTIETYVQCVAQFARHFRRSPDQLGPEDVRSYQVWLTETKQASWTVFNQSVSSLRFLYRVTLGRDTEIDRIPFAKRENKLPDVLSGAEIAAFFRAIDNLKHRTALMTMYASGLRISEALRLVVTGCRLGSHDDPRPARQGKEGSLHDPLPDFARGTAYLLARIPPRVVALPRTTA